MCTFFSTERKIAASLAVLRSTVLLSNTVVLHDIHSIEYFTQITQDLQDTSTDVLLYSGILNVSMDE